VTAPLYHDERGATVVEFALIMPVLFGLVLVGYDLGTAQYMRAVLEGAMQQAGRAATLQTAQTSQTTIDTYVSDRIKAVLPGASVAVSRKNYAAFADAGRPEDFTDTNANGRRDSGECFTDLNGNSTWDADVGKSGNGSANDIVVYTATVTYATAMPVKMFGINPITTLTASTTLRNQPYGVQATRTGVQVCT
jgi:Flp pilus assembly protein TadG